MAKAIGSLVAILVMVTIFMLWRHHAASQASSQISSGGWIQENGQEARSANSVLANALEEHAAEQSSRDVLRQGPSVHTLAGNRMPLANVMVECLRKGQRLVEFQTDAEGSAQVEIQTGDELIGRKPGYVETHVTVPAKTTGSVEIILNEAHSICGRVLDGLGLPARNVYVLAWKSSLGNDGVSSAVRAMNGDPASLIVTTNDQGGFKIDALEPGQAYGLCAGGNGFLLQGGPVRAEPGGPPVEITVNRGFAAQVRLVDELGMPIDIRQFEPGSYTYEAGARTTAAPYSCQTASAVLAGVDCREGLQNPYTWRFLFIHAEPVEYIPTFLNVMMPGFSIEHQEIPASWIAETVNNVDLKMRRSTPGWGSLRVAFDQDESGTLRPATARPAGLLILESATGDQVSLSISEGQESEVVLQHIPYGHYKWSFLYEFVLLRYPGEGVDRADVEIDANEARVVVTTPACGSLTVTILRQDGTTYDGSATIEIGAGKPRVITENDHRLYKRMTPGAILIEHVASFTFAKPPYVFRCLPVGDYLLKLNSPFAVNYVLGKPVSVKSGIDALAEFQEPPTMK